MKVIHPRFPDYEVYDDGRVIRFVPTSYHGRCGEVFGRVLVSGYRQFHLRDSDGKACQIRANRLIAEAFHGPAPTPTHHAAHIDGNKLNNSAGNLRWATSKENHADRVGHGTTLKGEKIGNSWLTADKVLAIRAAFTDKRGDLRRIARSFGVSFTHVRRIIYRESWAHVPSQSALDRQRGLPCK